MKQFKSQIQPSYQLCLKSSKRLYLLSQISSIIHRLQTYHDGRFYELRITCTDNYPAEPPIVKFISKVNMTCVDPRSGLVQHSKLSATKNWNRNLGIEQVLTGLRREMCSDSNRRLRQPDEGLTF
jgi:ubiquitin-conjugating enzyme E2 variant